MRRSIFAALVVLVACGRDAGNPVGPIGRVVLPAIVDATNGGREGFYFLSPIVANPGVTGPFDGTLTPRARICALDATRSACLTTIATIVTGNGAGKLSADATGAFAANWSSPSSLDPSNETRYRLAIELDVGGQPVVLGYADIWVAAKPPLKNVPEGFIGLIRGKNLQIRFGILPATVSHVVVMPNPVSIDIGGTQQMAATAYDTHNNVVTGAVFAWSSDNSDVATVSASGVVTGIANGAATISASTSGVTGTASVSVVGTPPAPPVAVNDGPAENSVPGDPFRIAFNTELVSGGTQPGLLDNDYLGSPPGTIVSIGGGDLGGDVTSFPLGNPVEKKDKKKVHLVVNPDGSFTFSDKGFTGPFTFHYRLQNENGFSDGVVTIVVGEPPVANDDEYPIPIIGNVSIHTSMSTGFSLLANDAGDRLQATVVSSPNGYAEIRSDGTFYFNPEPGFTGTARFTYTVTNGFGTSGPATVSIQVTTPIWFVNPAAPASGDGRLETPFNCLVDAGTACYDDSANEEGDVLFIASGSYTNSGSLVLKYGQTVIGQGASSSVAAITGLTNAADSYLLPSTGGTAPSIMSPANGVTLAGSNRLYGFNIGNTGGIGIFGNGFGTLTVRDVSLPGEARSGQALGLTNGTFATGSTFGTIVSTGANAGLGLTQVGGAFTVLGGTIISSSETGIFVNQSSAGAFNFGDTRVTGTSIVGVSLNSNVANIAFRDLDVSPAADAQGVSAVGNTGLLSTTSGTIATQNNRAIRISGRSVPTPLNVVLTSVSTTGGEYSILLENTLGSFSIVGDASPGSGGTIAQTNAAAIRLNNVTNVALNRMILQNNAGQGVHGDYVSGLSIANSTIAQNGNAVNEAGIRIDYLLGTANLTNNEISNSFSDNVFISNGSGVLNLTLSQNTIRNTGTQFPRRGIVVDGSGTSSISTSITGNTLQDHVGQHIAVSASGSATMNTGVAGNMLSCSALSSAGGHCGVEIVSTSTAPVGYAVSNNSIVGALNYAVNLANRSASGTLTGSFRNNTIGVQALAGSGAQGHGLIVESRGTSGSHTILIAHNVIRRYGGDGITMSSSSGSNLDATVFDNTIAQPDATNSVGISFSNVSPSGQSCLALSANSITGAGGPLGRDFSLAQTGSNSVRLPGYAGANNDNTAVAAFIRASQTNATLTTPTGLVSNNVASGGGGYVGGAACATP